MSLEVRDDRNRLIVQYIRLKDKSQVEERLSTIVIKENHITNFFNTHVGKDIKISKEWEGDNLAKETWYSNFYVILIITHFTDGISAIKKVSFHNSGLMDGITIDYSGKGVVGSKGIYSDGICVKSFDWYESGNMKSYRNVSNSIYETTKTYMDAKPDKQSNVLLKSIGTTNVITGRYVGKLKGWYTSAEMASLYGGLSADQETGQIGRHQMKNYFYYETNAGPLAGKLMKWYRNGQRSKREHYNNGVKQGKLRSWYENGQMMRDIYYSMDGVIVGVSRVWHKNGKLKEYTKWDEGKPIYSIHWDHRGNKTYESK